MKKEEFCKTCKDAYIHNEYDYVDCFGIKKAISISRRTYKCTELDKCDYYNSIISFKGDIT